MIYSHLPQRSGRSIQANTNNPPQDPPPQIIKEKPTVPIPDVITPKITLLEKKITLLEKKITLLEKKITSFEKNIPLFEKKIVSLEKKIPLFEKKITLLENNIPLLENKITLLEKKIITLKAPKQESKITKEIPKKSLFRLFLTKICNLFGRR